MYFVPITPSSGEQSNYDRFRRPFVWASRNVTWTWRGTDAAWVTAQSRMVLGVAPQAWVTPVSGNHTYTFTVPNGHYLATPEVFNTAIDVLSKALVINDTGAPLGNQDSWVARDRFEIEHVNPKVAATAFVPYSTGRPYVAKLKPRTIVNYTTLLPKSQLWVRSIQVHQRNVKFRRRFLTDAGDSIIVGEQKYSYHGDAVSTQGRTAGLQPPLCVVRDGPRGWGTVGYVCKVRGRRGHKGDYFLESGGRLAHMQVDAFTFPAGVTPFPGGVQVGDGYINTLAGWRVTTPAIGANPEAGWEHVGDWSRVPGIKRMHEPWGFCTARRLADNSLDPRDGFEFWVADTLNHRWLYVDAWPAHPDISGVTGRPTVAQFPPAGYTPVTARGQAVVVHFAGNTDSTPGAFLNGPWDINLRKQDGKLYGTCFEGNAIVRCNLDGTGMEFVVQGSAQTDVALGIPSRLMPSSIALGDTYRVVGARTAGATSIVLNGNVNLAQGAVLDALNGVQLTLTAAATFASGGANMTVSVQPLSAALPDAIFASTANTLRGNMRDGPNGVCTLTRPSSFDFDSNGDMNVIERYTYAVRKCTPDGHVTTMFYLPRANLSLTSSSSSTQDFGLTVDSEGTCGPLDDVFLSGWANSTFRYSAAGVNRGTWDFQSGAVMRNGPLDIVDGANYGWANDAFEGRILHLGNDSGSQYVEITKRLATDPQPDEAKHGRGVLAYNTAKMDLTHGHGGWGELGQPNIAEMGSWSDMVLTTYLTAKGVPAGSLADVIYWIRWACIDFDYSTDTTPPAPPAAPLVLVNVSVN